LSIAYAYGVNRVLHNPLSLETGVQWMPTLYVVATPIGNLSDFSPRGIATLQSVALIAAEDTRITQRLLSAFDIHTQLTSCHEHNERAKAEWIVGRMLTEGIDVALTTDAGTPCISDPGSLLTAEAVKNGIPVIAIAGPTAMAAALSVSGLPVEEFTFFGFLPRAKGELREKLLDMATRSKIAVVHESPHRVEALLTAVVETLPHTAVSVSCDLTKKFEATVRGEVGETLAKLKENPKMEKGEYCIVLQWRDAVQPSQPPCALTLEAQLFDGIVRGRTLRESMDALLASGERKNAVYAASLRVKALLAQPEDE
jgi:16S rRNA (cytidine1402-2'-O)-methyltransferase